MVTEANWRISVEQGRNTDVARCDRVVARLDFAAATPDSGDAARTREAAASAVGDPTTAVDAASEAITLAGPRHLPGPHAAALVARGQVHAAAGDLRRARDDADAALRIARRHGLAWPELDALDLHADLEPLTAANPAHGPPRPPGCGAGSSPAAWTPTPWPPSNARRRPGTRWRPGERSR